MQNDQEVPKKRKSVECPHCNENFFIEFQIQIAGMLSENQSFDWLATLRADQVEFLKKSEDIGLTMAFRQVVEVAMKDQMPRTIEKYFLTWLEKTQPLMIPSFALEFYKKEFPNTEIKIIGSQGILGVLANRQLKCFVPSEIIVGKNLRKANGSGFGTNIKLPVNEADLIQWKRTRMGYVVKGSVFEGELKSISVGSFVKPRIEIMNRR